MKYDKQLNGITIDLKLFQWKLMNILCQMYSILSALNFMKFQVYIIESIQTILKFGILHFIVYCIVILDN